MCFCILIYAILGLGQTENPRVGSSILSLGTIKSGVCGLNRDSCFYLVAKHCVRPGLIPLRNLTLGIFARKKANVQDQGII